MQTQKEIILFSVSATLIFFMLISFIITILFLTKKQQHGFQKEMELIKTGFEKELLKTQLEIQEETLQYISLELHDNVGHFLSLAKLHLTSLQIPVGSMNEKVEAAIVLIAGCIDEIRNISKSLSTDNLRSNGLIKTVEQLIDQLKRSGHFEVSCTVTGKPCFLDDQKEIVLFRIVQESLNNIIKHSKANRIKIQFHFDEKQLRLSINDNGIGFNADSMFKNKYHDSCGIKNIIKRSFLINAEHQILSSPGKGTIIKITTPY